MDKLNYSVLNKPTTATQRLVSYKAITTYKLALLTGRHSVSVFTSDSSRGRR